MTTCGLAAYFVEILLVGGCRVVVKNRLDGMVMVHEDGQFQDVREDALDIHQEVRGRRINEIVARVVGFFGDSWR